jgi:hypothetical protein
LKLGRITCWSPQEGLEIIVSVLTSDQPPDAENSECDDRQERQRTESDHDQCVDGVHESPDTLSDGIDDAPVGPVGADHRRLAGKLHGHRRHGGLPFEIRDLGGERLYLSPDPGEFLLDREHLLDVLGLVEELTQAGFLRLKRLETR